MRFCLTFLLLALLLAVLLPVRPAVCQEEEAPLTEEGQAPSSEVFSPEQLAQLQQAEEKHEFQAEVSRMMDILINSLYSNKEIFVREIISNAADALDKIRYLSLTNQTSLGDETKLEIRISYDPEQQTLTFRDYGVGMTKEELIKHLGIVAKSGTSDFVDLASKGLKEGDLSLIGQFGVGFYSVYLVADKVQVISKSNNDDQYVWESTAEKSFTVAKDPRGNTLKRGTEIILHLKSDAQDFLKEDKLAKIVEKYSEFINYPIYLLEKKESTKEVAEEAEPAEKEPSDDLDVAEEEDEQQKPQTKQVKSVDWVWRRLNEVKAIWARPSSEVSEEEYRDFYQSFVADGNTFVSKSHFTAEGEISFRALLFVPEKADPHFYDHFQEPSKGLKLYVRRVFISDELDDLLPKYLNFVKGVIDSEDLPLNVNRETLAQSKVLNVIGKKVTRKALEMLKKLSEEDKKERAEVEEAIANGEDKVRVPTRYNTFFDFFGKSIKLGVMEDKKNKDKLVELLRFHSSKVEGKTSLAEYLERRKKNQKNIFFIAGESLDKVKNSPFMETLERKGYEVLFMVDPLDEYLMQALTEYQGFPLQSITKDNLKIDDKDAQVVEKYQEEFKELSDWLEKLYGKKVTKVQVSNRIQKSPMVIVTGQYGWSANMERLMQSHSFAQVESESKYMAPRKTLEINVFHPIIKELLAKVKENSESEELKDLANLLYDATLLQSGFIMKEPADFATRIQRVVANGLSVDPDAPVEIDAELQVEEEEERNLEEPIATESLDDSAEPEHEEL